MPEGFREFAQAGDDGFHFDFWVGLGALPFADHGVLREFDITSGDPGILVPLLSFDLGIESGQIAVAIF